MDQIFIHGLKLKTTIGVHEWEKRLKRTLIFDLDMAVDTRAAAADDDLTKTLNYSAVNKAINALVSDSQFELIESLAERVARLLLEDFGVEWCRVRINKPFAIKGVPEVGVVIERSSA